jgi:hypothetical protein
MYTSIFAVLALAASTIAAPAPIDKRQGAFIPISKPNHLPQSYSASQVSAAVAQGCKYYRANQQVGSNDYPHRYNNYEGFDFRVAAPWQEFPITRSGVYTGGEFALLVSIFL